MDNTKTLLGIGGLLWIGYILYSNNKQNQLIKSLQDRLGNAEQKLSELSAPSIVPADTAAPQALNASGGAETLTPAQRAQLYSQRMRNMTPQGTFKTYNASKNATVAPAPTQVSVPGAMGAWQ